MPAYAGVNQATLLRENRQVFCWQNETIAAGLAIVPVGLSLAFQLERVRSVSYPWGFSVEVLFGVAPGVFEVDVMGSDTDDPRYYNVIGKITTVNSFNVGRFDCIGTNLAYPKYVALYIKTLPNAGAVTAQLTR